MVDLSGSEKKESINKPVFNLPSSNLVSADTRDAIKKISDYYTSEEYAEILASVPPIDNKTNLEDIRSIRNQQAEDFYASDPLYLDMKSRYRVSVHPESIAGVYTEIFIPVDGVSQINNQRVLINLHGGGFTTDSRTSSHLESMPIAALGKIKVVSVDYSMAPECEFPAASEDVTEVYKALLRDYEPENIGIYGYSAGGLLTAQSIAWFQKEKLPLPGAVAMSCGAAHFWMDGFSGSIQAAINDFDLSLFGVRGTEYFRSLADLKNPLAFPGFDSTIMANFPPSLLITSTQDFSLSSVVRTHSQLVTLGVEADLHVWEGVDHSFLCNACLPESREASAVIVSFFDKHLK